MSSLFQKLYEGGPFFMYSLLALLIVVLLAFIFALLKKQKISKTINLINLLVPIGIVWGFLGQIIGLIMAFEFIQNAGDISPTVLAGGLKISFYAPVFGMIIFIIGKVENIILTWVQKGAVNEN